jgi:transketolase
MAEVKYNARTFSMLGMGGSMFGIAALALREKYPLKLLSADMARVAGAGRFIRQYPNDFYNLGIAEQNMIAVSAGLASEGYKCVDIAQACFISMRSFEQVRQMLGYMGYSIVLVGVASGYSLTYFGNTHYALEDIALMRTIPDMTVVAPCDAFEAVKVFEQALTYDKPVYIRLYGGTNTPIVYKQNFDFKIGNAITLREGNGIQIIATGSMVAESLKVADKLKEEGYSVSLIDMYTIKPLDTNVISKDAKLIVTVEEHYLIGGLGSAVADYLSSFSSHPKLLKIGVENRFSKVGDYPYLLEFNGLTSDKIIEKINKSL